MFQKNLSENSFKKKLKKFNNFYLNFLIFNGNVFVIKCEKNLLRKKCYFYVFCFSFAILFLQNFLKDKLENKNSKIIFNFSLKVTNFHLMTNIINQSQNVRPRIARKFGGKHHGLALKKIL
jgi:hypothetical protein